MIRVQQRHLYLGKRRVHHILVGAGLVLTGLILVIDDWADRGVAIPDFLSDRL